VLPGIVSIQGLADPNYGKSCSLATFMPSPFTTISKFAISEEKQMNIQGQLVCAWGAIGFTQIGFLGFIVYRHCSPMPPNLSAHEIAAIYQENTLTMRSGFLLFMT
jgi:hypothetical protein